MDMIKWFLYYGYNGGYPGYIGIFGQEENAYWN